MLPSRLKSEQDILVACEKAIRLAPTEFPDTLPASKELLGSPEWYPFELEAWPIGESVRTAFVRSPRLKKRQNVLAKVADVATYRNLRRGRQSFVMALGFVAACQYAGRLAVFLSDPDVDGQVLDTLIKMKAPGHAREVTLMLQSDKAWIRRLATKYLDRYSKSR
ncbi:MAG: hypothetical protein WCE87_03095 [Candidatus Udaeobacter sp.]